MTRKTTPTHVLLNQIELSSASSSVTFSNIPQGYGDLVLQISAKVTSSAEARLRFNEDAGSNYYFVQLAGDGSGTLSNSGTATGGWINPNTGISTTNFDSITAQIMDYSATDKSTTYLSRFSPDAGYVNALAVRWADSSAISNIEAYTTSNAFAIGSIFSLYGVYA